MEGTGPWSDDSQENQPKVDDVAGVAPQPVSISEGFAPMNQGAMLTGTTQMPTGQLIYLQPPSGASKVLGIIMLVYGVIFSGVSAITLLTVNLLPATDLAAAYGLDDAAGLLLFLNSTLVFSLATGVGFIVAGVWAKNYQRKGVILALALTAIEFLFGVAVLFLFPEFNAGGFIASGTSGAIVENLFGSLFCGLIWAIPLMVANNGLDDSKLLG